MIYTKEELKKLHGKIIPVRDNYGKVIGSALLTYLEGDREL